MATVRNPFIDLESNDPAKVEETKAKLKEQFNKTKDQWLMNGVYDHFMQSQSLKVVDLLAMVNEPHDKYFLDKALDGIRGRDKLQHLTLLGYLVRRNPLWLYKIFQHQLFNQLLQIFENETDIVIVVSALLILNILIPLVPRLVGPILPKIFAVFSKLAALNTKPTDYQDVQLVHLQISLYTLFHRLYGMFPINFLNFLRKEYMTSEKYAVFSHTVKPMLDTVRVNHLLITGNEEWEKSASRWNNMESHDIIMSCANLLMSGGSTYKEQPQRGVYASKHAFNCNSLLDKLKVTDKQTVAEYCKELGKGADDPTLFSPSARFMKNVSKEKNSAPIPLTPITRGYEVSSPYSEHEGSSPPEAAVEATPETTPIPDRPTTAPPSVLISSASRPLSSLILDNVQQGATVPMADRSFPGSPIKKESSPIRYSAPEILLYSPSQPSSRKIDMLLADRNLVNEEYYAVEMKSILSSTIRITNDLSSKDRTQSVISSPNTSHVDGVGSKKENGTVGVSKYDFAADSVDDFDVCDLEKSGSPCSSGGLHMPDNKSLCNFAIHMKYMRSRHLSQCNSDSERFSPNNSPLDAANYFENSKVRRTNSCPEMKKSSPNSTTLSSDSPVLEERDENDEFYDHEKGVSTRRKMKKPPATKVTIETQTEDVTSMEQFPYEHLFLDVFPPLHRSQPDEQASPTESVNSLEERSTASVYEKATTPSKLLQKYIEAASQCYDDKVAIRSSSKSPSIVLENKYLLDQLRLMGVQLQLEEHKREVHAERNRRLFHRSRRNKTLEEHNTALISQVKALQKEIEHYNDVITKISKEKKAQIEREQENSEFWRNQFGTLQHEHKIVTSRCQKVEALLKEEKDFNEQTLKQLNETKAVLGDITNDLRSSQKDALEVKDLRRTVAELQSEVVKAGELITLYSSRLIEGSLPIDDKNHVEGVVGVCIEEKKKLNTIISDQEILLKANGKLLSLVRMDTDNKENQVRRLDQELKSTRETLENSIQEWKKKFEELKALYDQEKMRSNELENDLEMQGKRFKLLMKSTQPKMVPQKDMTIRRGMIPLIEDNIGPSGSGSKSSQSVPKSPKSAVHAVQQHCKIALENKDALIPPHEQSRERESPLRAKTETTSSSASLGAREVSVDSDGGSDVFKSITKKKARTECAETGHLRSISYTQFDSEPSTRKE